MRIPRQLVVAGLTLVTVASISHAILPPSQGGGTLARQQQQLHRQYQEARRRELETQRLRGNDLGEAVRKDRMRPSDVRPAEKASERALQSLLRRP